MSQGKLIVISGASGVGKGTVLELMMARRPELTFSVSATTRAPRPGEVNGQHYFFVPRDEFLDMIARDEFLEYDEHNACYYGTTRAQIAANVCPQYAGGAGVRCQHTQQQLDGGALAGAVFTDQTQNAAGGQRKVQSLQGKAGEMLGKPFDFNGVVHSSSSNTS